MKLNYKEMGMDVVGVGAGLVIANAINKVLPLATLSNNVKGFLYAAVGVLLPYLVPSQKNLLRSVGLGMASFGARTLLANNGFTISGIEDQDVQYIQSAKERALEQTVSGISANLDEVERVMSDPQVAAAVGRYYQEQEGLGSAQDAEYVGEPEYIAETQPIEGAM